MSEAEITDSLTSLHNARFLTTVVGWETARADRYDFPLTLILLDVDHLKQVNEAHGRPAGDKVLKSLAALLQSTVRNVDFVFRYGEDEFAILLPHTDLEGSSHVRRRIVHRLEPSDRPSELGVEDISVTIVACEYCRGSHFQRWLSDTEHALLRAKGGDDDDDPAGVPAHV